MRNKFVLEVSVETVEAAMAAERGGAHRIEFCSNLAEGGATPDPKTLEIVRERVRLPVFSMNRPRSGNFVYSDAEFEIMCRDIETAKELGVDGIVAGLLDAHGEIDVKRTKQLVEQAYPLAITFHRAFDECRDLAKAFEDVVKTGVSRLLSSGGKNTAPEGFDVLGELVRTAGDRLIVMPGSGLHAGNIRDAVEKTGAHEYHAGLSSVIANPAMAIGDFEEAVRKLAAALAGCD